MTKFDEAFLDRLREALPVSQVVGQRVKLKRQGREFVGLSPFNKERSPSFTVNDAKRFWHDFSSGRHGDIFAFEMETTGCDFTQAVEALAAIAGLSIDGRQLTPQQRRQAAARRATAVHGPAPADDGNIARGNAEMDAWVPAEQPEQTANGHDRQGLPSGREQRRMTRTWDYCGADGDVRYQVCRWEWLENGARHKTFSQRRPAPGEPGVWIWGLDAGEYCRRRPGNDWVKVNDKRAEWPERLVDEDGCPHGLYRFPELIEEVAQGEDAPTIYVAEGEKDVDTLTAWGLVATTASGGARHWEPHMAEQLRDMDVVVLADHDKAGRAGAQKKAASLRGVARRVRLLDWREHWRGLPKGADVTDWRDKADGTPERFLEIVDRLRDWVPTVPESSFSALRFIDVDAPGPEQQWLIKKVLTRGEVSLWYGPPSCGKSFLLTDAGLAIARGVSWFGQRVTRGLVVCQAGEGGLGLKKRLRAYRRYHNIPNDEDIPFVLLPQPIDLFSANTDVDKMIAEVAAWADFYGIPLELVIIDTLSAATPGAEENASSDMTLVMGRARKMARVLRCHVAIVHHTNASGQRPRGHSSLMGNVDNAIEVIRTEQTDIEEVGDRRIMRDVRQFIVRKQKDEVDDFNRSFILRQVQLGTDPDADPITSCVISEIGAKAPTTRIAAAGYFIMKPNNLVMMRALAAALKDKGRSPPPGIKSPEWTKCVTVGDWIDALAALRFAADPDDPDGKKLRARCKKAIERACGESDWIGKLDLIGKDREWIWRTDRKVHDVDPAPRAALPRPSQPEPEPVGDLLDPDRF